MIYDAVIIGGGLAGLLSAIELSESGYKTAVVSKGDPLCSISTGCIDLALDFDALPPEHPYGRAGREKVDRAIGRFLAIMEEAGLPYRGESRVNRTVFTPVARKRTTCLVPLSMEEAHDSDLSDIHIIAFRGMKDFFPGYFDCPVSVYDCALKTTVSIAARLEDPEGRREFIAWLKDLKIERPVLALPAVLGMNDPRGLMDEIAGATRCRVMEIPTLPPSIPGQRLFRTLKGRASELGTDFFAGNEVSRYESEGDAVKRLVIDQPGRPIVVGGRSFILATGSFVSGGLFPGKEEIVETVFRLPVFRPEGEPLLNGSFFNPDHPAGRAGIEVAPDYRPAGSRFANLFAAGTILKNSAVMKYACGHGVAVVTGLEAAASCMEYLK